MNLKLSYPLYKRLTPANDVEAVGYLDTGSWVNMCEIVIGKSIDGNSVWYKTEDGYFFWSGGFTEVEFEFLPAALYLLDEQAQMQLLAEAIEFCWLKYKHINGLTGIFIGGKKTGETIEPGLSLVFQVSEKKEVAAAEKIPGAILFKGFRIPTDVLAVQLATFDAQPGDTCSRINVLDVWGSVGLKVRRKENEEVSFYFLTNYHVAANNLIANRVFGYHFPQPLGGRQMMVPSQFSDPANLNFIGAMHEGIFSSFHDTALILLGDPSACSNTLPDGSNISGSVDLANDASFIGKEATIYGAVNKGKQRKIRSVNSSQFFSVPGHVHEMKQLIQIDKFSQPGDSGGAVMIGTSVIGLHVGSDDQFSYAIPITRILKFFNLEIA